MQPSTLLDVQNLRTYFKTEEGIIKAVDDVSFSIKPGETIGIVGESGSGKSVTSLSIMGLVQQPPGYIAGGKILYQNPEGFNGDLLTCSEKEMQEIRGKEIAMIFQEPMTSLNPVFRCGHQVDEALLIHNNYRKQEAKSITLELFEKVRLPDPERIYRSYPHELSGGQKQRVMIAMAMSCKPRVLIADEPTTALDVTVQKRILELMNQLKKESGASVIFITHDLGVISEIADRVIVMYKGKIVETGTVEQIFNQPQHPYTKSLIACRPPLDHRLERLPVVSDFMEVIRDEKGQLEILEKKNKEGKGFIPQKISEQVHKERQETLKSRSPIMTVKNLETWFPGDKNFWGKTTEYIKAVNNVSFDIFQGETLGLVGESGCGKTTLGRTLLRLIPARSGQVIYKGQDILSISRKGMKELRKNMQIIFQDPYSSLNPRLPIGHAIMEPMKVHRILDNDKQRKEKVIELLETVSLEAKHFNRYPHEFSGGQRQRICIARALSMNPEFIICDESVSALDVSVQAQVLNLLLELRERFGFTYVFISHDLSVVKFMSDRMLVMNQGEIVESGYADDIYSNPKSEYTRKLIEAIPG